ncbi:MAG: response regulator transcription factor [Planctomycetaceae bacterium]|nr:response regulator transcription factor [Planctomycetaceae bacterium]
MVKKNILLIEDEADIREMIRLRLKKEGFDVLTADSGEAGLALVLERRPDLVLLDLMLPIMSGFEVLRKIKAERTVSRVPILIVSARGEESDIVVGLELGADDFVTKPFTMTVLIARINALLRRSALPEDQVDHLLVAGPVQIDMTGYLAFLEGEPLILTKTEFHILYELVRAKGRVLTRNQLVEQAIGDAYVTDRTIDVHLTSLRNKLGNARALIETVRGVGYRFHGDAERSRM